MKWLASYNLSGHWSVKNKWYCFFNFFLDLTTLLDAYLEKIGPDLLVSAVPSKLFGQIGDSLRGISQGLKREKIRLYNAMPIVVI